MATRPLKSSARLWEAAPGPNQKYRDRKRRKQPDGTYKEFAGYGPTKHAATADLYDKIEAAQQQEHALAQVDTVNQVMAKLARHKRGVRGRKRKTIHNDLELYRLHVRPHIGQTPITEVTLEELEGIQTRLTSAGKYRTAELTTILLKSLYKQALRQYRNAVRSGRLPLYDLTEDLEPVRRPAEAEHKPNDLWTVDELGAFLKAGQTHYKASLRHLAYPLLRTAIATGLRRGELLSLRRQDIITTKLEDGTELHQLTVSGQYVYYDGKHHKDTPKSRAGDRQVPFGIELLDVLKEHMARLDKIAKLNPDWQPTDLLFPTFNGRPMDPSNIYRARDKIHALASEDLGRELPRATLHEMRGLYTTYLTRELVRQGKYNPKLVMRVLGHAHPNVALIHYNRVIEEDLAGAVFDPASRPLVAPVLEAPEAPAGASNGALVDNLVDNHRKVKDATSVEVAS